MRTFLLLFCTTVLGFNSDFSYSQAKVNIDSPREVTVDEVFQIITDQTNYNFLYPDGLFAGLPKVKLIKGLIKVDRLIAKSIPAGRFNVVISKDNTIIIEKGVNGDQIMVSGTVTDTRGAPIPSVTIRIKGTNKGAITDFDGGFKIQVPSVDNVLVFSSLGFKDKEVLVGDNLVLDVVLEDDVTKLEAVEVVSTGYQKISKERSAGAFSKPELSIAKDRAYSMNILQRIDGLVAGLTINNSPGASDNPYLVRGLTSLGTFSSDSNNPTGAGTNRGPLFVVDGIPTNNISYINPQDVEDITVLKDATASSIWGARASNGVIVITTKKGDQNSKVKVSYDVFTNIQGRPDLAYQPYMNSSEFISNAREVFDPVAHPYAEQSAYVFEGGGIPPHMQVLYDEYRGVISSGVANAKLDSISSISNRSQIDKLWYRPAMQTNHTLSLSAGGSKHSVYGSLAYTDTKSDRPGDSDRLYKVNIRQDFTFNDKISTYLITDLTKTKAVTKNNLGITYSSMPYQLFRDQNGNNMDIPWLGMLSEEVRADFEARSQIDLNYNPLDERKWSDEISDALNARLIAGINVELFDNLEFDGTYSYITGANKVTTHTSPESYIVRSELAQFTVADAPGDTPIYYLPKDGGRYVEGNLVQKNYTVRNQLSYDKSWNEGQHQLYAILGQEAQEQLTESSTSTIRGYDSLLLTSLPLDYATLMNEGIDNTVMPNSGTRSILENNYFSKSEVLSRFTSYYGNLSYTLNRRYTLNASWRRDKSNLFGLDKSAQNKPTWSVGGKWNIGREGFFTYVSAVNFLEVRATYGITGNAPIPGISSSYDILRPQTNYTNIGNTVVPLTLQTPGNDKLTWERTKTINFGVDFGLFDVIDGSVDIYKKKTNDLLGQLPLNVFSGFSSAIGNFGSMENKGIEITLTTSNIRTTNFDWKTIFTLAYNDNEITELLLPGDVATGNQKVDLSYLKGYPAFAIFAYDYQGLDEEGDPLIRLADGTVTKEPNITNPEDIRFMGTAQPIWSGGLSNMFRYKDFSLNVNAIYNLGHVMRRDVVTNFTGALESVPYSDFANRWKQPGDELVTDIPAYDPAGTLTGDVRDTDYYIKANTNVLDASYIKLRDITLSYALPQDFLNRIQVDNLSLRLSFSNIMLWKANDYGIDPEFQYSSFGTGIRNIKRNQGSVAFGLHLAL